MKGWNKIVVVFAVLLAAVVCKNLLAGQGDAEKLSKTVSIEKSVPVSGIEARNPTTNPEQVSVDKPTKEALIQKTRTLQMPFIANNGQMDEQVRFYAKTFGGTVFVTKDGEIVYALPEGRDVPAGASQEAGRGMKHGGSGAEGQGSRDACRDALHASLFINVGQGRKAVFGRHGQEPLVHADAECVAANTCAPFLHANNAGCPPERVLACALLAAYLPGLQKETTQRVVSTSMLPMSNVQSGNVGNEPSNNPHSKIQNPQSTLRGVTLKEHLVGGKIGGITGEQPSVTSVNYFKGNDKSKWKTNVPTYNRVNLGEVYQGIELSLMAYGDNVEKLFCVKPGASPECIKVQLDGSKSLRVNREGQLEVETELGLVKFTRPIAYQEIDGKRVDVAVEYLIHGSGNEGTEARGAGEKRKTPNSPTPQLTYRFTVASYDKTKDLIIDPLLASTYLGGSYVDSGTSITLDASGNVYVTGYAHRFNGGNDIIVSKFDRELKRLLANTLLGGGRSDRGNDLTIDASGNVYVTGFTSSSNFPTTRGAYDTSFNGGRDVFVSKLNGGLTSLLASTFLGSVNSEIGVSLFLDTSENVYVTGFTSSSNFPTTRGAYDTSFNGADDVFVSKLDSGLKRLLVSTFLGGSRRESGNSLTLDTSGNVYVTGSTKSFNFPTTSGAYDTSFNGNYDVFVSKLDSGLTGLQASTFQGGNDNESGNSLTLDASGNVYVTGYTYSSKFPTTSGAYDTSFNGEYDVFVSKLDSGLTGLQASTFLGGSSRESGDSLTIDTSGNVYVTGWTYSSAFPTTRGAYDTSFNGEYDVFVSKLDGNLSANQCVAESIIASHNNLTLRKGKTGDVTITVVGEKDCPVKGVAVTATIYGKGKRLIDVSPASQETDAGGQAVFSISAKDKKGIAVLKFKASGLDEVATVRVKVW